ncbi:MAG: tRNA3(Ser)-specific nuclease WapA [Chlamydiae bacterium]|nr:tRNA3(Ser)-specific nuclease WapA [Chlamydiota bacterium]
MKYIFLVFFYLHVAVFASFFEEEDPMHYYHVNVITGHLNLNFQDAELKSPISFTIGRNYSSTGALERTPDDLDLKLKNKRNSEWMFQGGWSFLPYTNLLVEYDPDSKTRLKAYLCEKNSSNLIAYSYFKTKKKYRYLRPNSKNTKASGNLSSRKKPQHNILKLSNKLAILLLPDGSERHYFGSIDDKNSKQTTYWRLDLEILPSKHRIVYNYSKEFYEGGKLIQIQIQNPLGTKTFASIDFDHSSYETEKCLHVKTSDGKSISYQMGSEFKERTYLQEVQTNIRPKETMHYQPGRKGIGARIGSMSFGDKEQFRVGYYHPSSKEKEKKWAKKPKKHSKGDKVQSIQFPDPETGRFIGMAEFSYYPEYTEVKDNEENLTHYFHDGEKLLFIKHFDSHGNLQSKVEFLWKNDNLAAKKMFDGNDQLLFSKSFVYDAAGNILREDWEDYATNCPLIRRQFSYTKKSRLLLFEEEDDGFSHRYEYLPHTDLLTKKFTLYEGKILLREFSFYNEDNLLICKITDDGTRANSEDLTDVTQRHIKTFELDEQLGLSKAMIESYLDLNTSTEQIFLKHLYTYNDRREIIAETVLYGPSEENYTIHFEYDERGNLIKQTTPLGRKNTFSYDEFGNLKASKEIGHLEKKFEYDFAGRPKTCIENGKITRSTYDIKGRLLEQIDKNETTIYQEYDSFGRCIKTCFPTVLNEEGTAYTPIVTSSYDIQGNLTTCTNPRGETTSTTYNILRKPVIIEYPDGNYIQHSYTKDGNIAKTTYPDQTEVHFTYDPWQRMTSKTTLSADGEILSEETWTYNTFHLLSYTNPMGLTTHYKYDELGRKIEERAEDRILTYSYDSLGFLEKITQGGMTKVQKHNVEGEVIEEWEEDSSGKIENHMRFFYDEEGRKERAIRITSKGEAEDFFFYDEEGHLCKHIDPLGECIEFLYTQTTNSLGQTIEQKTILDPLMNAQIEIFDANGRIVSIEKKDPDHQTVAKEDIFYDKAGNKAKRLVTIYEKNLPLRTYTTTWEYNERGWPIQEIEEGEKCTNFAYDSKGRLTKKTLPSGTILYHKYDGLDRLLELKSSDGSFHYTYTYGQGPLPTKAHDHIQHLTWERAYNAFGEMIAETRPDKSKLFWQYDTRGQCTECILPDHSSLEYDYSDLHLFSVTRYSANRKSQYTHTYLQFDENGRVCEEEVINDLGTTTTTHDLLERIENYQTPWHKASIEYGPSGLVTRIENSLFQIKEYQYDPLNQLLQEGDQQYQFDSLGNPLNAQVNQFNQIISAPNCSLSYNDNGNPIRQHSSDQAIAYEYDALSRLTTIHIPNEKHIRYTYDPFSRLYTKEIYENQNSFFAEYDSWSRKVTYFLYDKEKEIGALNEEKKIIQLKILGLGILGDIGGAIAIELSSEVYAPLHDFNGNIIALISSNGALSEKCDIDAFGKAVLSSPSINPWRFHSKRSEEHLIFFGERFYDPNLGRWLTPDPAGAIDSPNLYLYVQNSPLNRLDLFGLYSEKFHTEISISEILENSSPYVHCTAYFEEIQADWILFKDQFHKLQFTPEELQTGKIDIFHHFQDFFSKDGMGIGITIFKNGIKNTFHDFEESSLSIAEKTPGEGLNICMYTPTKGLIQDVSATSAEKNRKKETPEVIMTRQAMIAISETLSKISPKLLWLHISHSRAGAIGNAAIAGMSDDEQKAIRKKMLWLGIAPAEPLAKHKAIDAIDIYSNKDYITGPMGGKYEKMQENLPDSEKIYNIKFVPCISKWHEMSGYFADHAFMASTQQNSLKKGLDFYDFHYKFYKEKR